MPQNLMNDLSIMRHHLWKSCKKMRVKTCAFHQEQEASGRLRLRSGAQGRPGRFRGGTSPVIIGDLHLYMGSTHYGLPAGFAFFSNHWFLEKNHPWQKLDFEAFP
jgi:hypothetical protein